MSESKKPDHERIRKLVSDLNEATRTEGKCPYHDWSSSCWGNLRYCARNEDVCHCCDKHACEGATK